MPRLFSALRVGVMYAWGMSQAVISLHPASPAVFTLPSSVLASLRTRICGRVFYVKTLHWRARYGTGRPRFNSSVPLLGNLTTLELLTLCEGRLQKV
jgi:hypothetical protein